MENIRIVFTFRLANGSNRSLTINDIKSSITETEIVALGNKLIQLRWQYNNSSFAELLQAKKLTIVEEVF
ncbi:MAG: DUF2922 domain-containing protein [Oscillospiraceae bacterium]|nr:DUF2922 domain-containing protein [Oscillospiraceae bacterium]